MSEEELLAQIEAKRNDRKFMARLRERMAQDGPMLDRMAATECRHLVEPFTTSTMLRAPGAEAPRLVHYPDGTYGVEHKCRMLGSTLIICAPRLSSQHTLTWELHPGRPVPSVDRSIDCPDCDLHGFIKQGRWLPVEGGVTP